VKTLGTIERTSVVVLGDGSVTWVANAWIDTDGAPAAHGNPNHQSQTSLVHHGMPVNADEVPYVVVPPLILLGVPEIVLGCRAQVTRNGTTVEAVVADIGPPDKIGEISPACAERLGLSGDPITGGEDADVIEYRIWPGVPAEVDGVIYRLQAFPR